jgi:hypothetical protein
MLGSFARPGGMTAGLLGPWSMQDPVGWFDDLTLDYNVSEVAKRETRANLYRETRANLYRETRANLYTSIPLYTLPHSTISYHTTSGLLRFLLLLE